ncbi:monofunctional biosynthetic peptidoglycan transglycosylase [Falsirhodobacter deserti]|uniref:monofunctional biosynthetic peptidoglycan transglycosylase n=1 Tax=Falsirhodobacter deserti TaxID=1365611 RepID=UPI000FE39416|nr:monofunctional biosynthetic peptidoglycan transglycosylase [Falsirhodobacter deserti]
MAAKRSSSRSRRKGALPAGREALRKWGRRIGLGALAAAAALVLLFAAITPPMTPYMMSERMRLGGISHETVSMNAIAPVMARSVVAAEDANFCRHWGFDMSAIRSAMAAGSNRGASTLSQQVVKNVFLWQGRSWVRKALEAVLTPAVELTWSKRHILNVYLNVAEFGEGIFGVQAAARHYFGVDAANLTAVQAARLAAILPNPKQRDPVNPTTFVRGRSQAALSGAATIRADGRAGCFQG